MRTKYILIIILFNSILITNVYSQKANNYYQKGNENIKYGNYEDAILNFTKSITLNSNEASYYIGRGMAYYGLKNYEKGLLDFAEAEQIGNFSYKLYLYKGLCLYYQSSFEKAISSFNQVIFGNYEEPGLKPEARLFKAWSFYKVQDYNTAIYEFDNLISDIPKYANAYNGLAWCYFELNDINRATIYWVKSSNLGDVNAAYCLKTNVTLPNTFSQEADNHIEKASEYIRQNLYRNAIEEYSLALEIEPLYLRIYYDRGNLFLKTNDYSSAINDLTMYLTLLDSTSPVFMNYTFLLRGRC